MALDPYAPCPCGNGKKLKFCCADFAPEMERALQLQNSNQLRAALKILEKLEEDHPNQSWIITNHASVLIHIEREADARELLKEFFKIEPRNALARVLDATAAYSLEGYESAKKALHIAVQLGAKSAPDMVAALLAGVASELYASGKFMAARAHVALSMRFCGEEQQQQVFMQLMELDGNQNTPFLLRGVHPLAQFETDNTESQAKYKKAIQLSAFGCWEEGAKHLRELTGSHPESPELWQNLGLMLAWDGNETEAILALRNAAGLFQDPPKAIECETVAQALELNSPEERIPVGQQIYTLESPSQVITQLDQLDRLERFEVPQEEDQPASSYPSAMYYLLNKSVSEMPAWSDASEDDLPAVIAQVSIYDAVDGERESAEMFVTGRSGEKLEDAVKHIESALDRLINEETAHEGQKIYESVPKSLKAMIHDWYFAPETPAVIRHKFEEKHWSDYSKQTWLELPNPALDGKTPREAATQPEMTVRLEAAINVLDAHADRRSRILDVDFLRSELQLEPVASIEITDETSISGLSFLQLMRTDVPNLSDDDLIQVLNRAILMHHNRFLRTVLTTTYERTSVHSEIDILRLLHTLVDLQRDSFDREATLEWIKKGHTLAGDQENPFEAVLQWEMRELVFRLDDPNDPELNPLLMKLNENYVRKLPRLREYLDGLLEAYDVTPPWDDNSRIVVADSAAGTGGVWSPDAEAAPAEGEGKKLWVPGQD